MESEDYKEPLRLKIGKLEIEPYVNVLRGVGLSVQVGEGVFYHSIRAEITLLFVYFGVHFIWDNP